MANWLKERVENRLAELGLGAVEAATAAGIERTFIRDILIERKRSVRADGAEKLARALGGSKEMYLYESSAPSASISPIAQSDTVSIPHLDIRFGMGGGAHYDDIVQSTPMSFTPEWLAQLTTSKPEHLFWATGFGDSMYPTIGDRDILLVDRSQRDPRIRDQIWALNQYGQGMIKRLRSTSNGYDILSDNPQVPPETASDGSMEVIGRVVAIIRRV